MVVATDWPNEFKSRRSIISELLFSCKMSRCIGCDHLELPNHDRKTVEIDGVGSEEEGEDDDEKELNNNHNYIEAYVIVDEIMRIKNILLSKEEPNSVLLESLRKLKSMSISMDVLTDTEIRKVVNSLSRYSSDKIRTLAKTLLAYSLIFSFRVF